jgi:Fic family protein
MDEYQKTVRMWQSFKIKTEADLAVHLDSFRILFAYNSNKIENDNTTYDDTYEVFVNGRTGRTIMNYYLILNDHPPITVHDEDRKDYYAALEAYHSELGLEPPKDFLKEQTVKTWAKTLEREQKRSVMMEWW